jgi:hypothetical protein
MRHSTHHFGSRFVLVALLATALGWTVAAGASMTTSSRTARGGFAFASDYTAPLNASKSAEISQLTYHGAIHGIAIDDGTQTIQSNGSFAGRGIEYCSACSLAGKTGAFTAKYKYSGSGTTYSGTLTFTRGFGKLAGLTGGGAFKGNVQTNSNTYVYRYKLS